MIWLVVISDYRSAFDGRFENKRERRVVKEAIFGEQKIMSCAIVIWVYDVIQDGA